jgi:hypothetical protein
MPKLTVQFQIDGNQVGEFSAVGTDSVLRSVIDDAKTAMQQDLDNLNDPEWQAAWVRFVASSREWQELRKAKR